MWDLRLFVSSAKVEWKRRGRFQSFEKAADESQQFLLDLNVSLYSFKDTWLSANRCCQIAGSWCSSGLCKFCINYPAQSLIQTNCVFIWMNECDLFSDACQSSNTEEKDDRKKTKSGICLVLWGIFLICWLVYTHTIYMCVCLCVCRLFGWCTDCSRKTNNYWKKKLRLKWKFKVHLFVILRHKVAQRNTSWTVYKFVVLWKVRCWTISCTKPAKLFPPVPCLCAYLS